MLTAERAREVFSYDAKTGLLTWKAKGVRVLGFRKNQGYLCVSVDDHSYSVHRIIWLMETGSWPKRQLRHKDGNLANNRFENLTEIEFKRGADLTAERVRAVFSYDASTGFLSWRAPTSPRNLIGERVRGNDYRGYLSVQIDGRRYPIQKLIWLMEMGSWPKFIGFKNGNYRDTRFCNLYETTHGKYSEAAKKRFSRMTSEERRAHRATHGVKTGEEIAARRAALIEDHWRARGKNVKAWTVIEGYDERKRPIYGIRSDLHAH